MENTERPDFQQKAYLIKANKHKSYKLRESERGDNMTLLIGIIRDNQCVLSGDYRATSVENENIFHDNVQKIYKANDNLLIGFSGDVSFSIKHGAKINSFINSGTTTDAAARKTRQWLKKNSDINTHQTVILVGKADNGKPSILVISHFNDYKR
jgi:ATP-dependent protease HslVU (ClpYQ) peptidase subunit